MQVKVHERKLFLLVYSKWWHPNKTLGIKLSPELSIQANQELCSYSNLLYIATSCAYYSELISLNLYFYMYFSWKLILFHQPKFFIFLFLFLPPESNFLTLVLLNKLRCHAHFLFSATSYFQPIRLLDPDCCYKFTYLMANSADPDQLASEANWSGSTLFAKAGYIRFQQDKG